MSKSTILENLKKADINIKDYAVNDLLCENTNFLVLSRENGLGFEPIKTSILKSWPHFVSILGNRVSNVAIVDYDMPIGGGPLGPPYVIGVYSSGSISKDLQIYIKDAIGWEHKESTLDYINSEYVNYTKPVESYVDDVVFHELGHLYFGFGVTRTNFHDLSESWFSLGLGLVYDRLIWNMYYEGDGPIVFSLVDMWESKFSKIADLDQHLVNPDLSKDKKYRLERMQVFNHGKAYSFLKRLRKDLGNETFDYAVNKLLSDDEGELSYYRFKSILSDNVNAATTLKRLENSFSIL